MFVFPGASELLDVLRKSSLRRNEILGFDVLLCDNNATGFLVFARKSDEFDTEFSQ